MHNRAMHNREYDVAPAPRAANQEILIPQGRTGAASAIQLPPQIVGAAQHIRGGEALRVNIGITAD